MPIINMVYLTPWEKPFDKLIENISLESYWSPALWRWDGVCVTKDYIYMWRWNYSFWVMGKSTYTTTVNNTYSLTNAWGICVTKDENIVYYTNYWSTLYTWSITKWDISTLSNTSSTSALSWSSARDCSCSPDWKKVYVWYHGWGWIEEYTLTTPWVLSSGVTKQKRQFPKWNNRVNGVWVSPDWKYIFVLDQTWSNHQMDVYQYELWTAWDLSTINSTEVSKNSFTWYSADWWGIDISRDGSWMYINVYDNNLYHYAWFSWGSLPSVFQEVQYIENTSTWPRINTWIIPTQNTVSQIKFRNLWATWNVIYWMYNWNDSSDYRFFNNSNKIYWDVSGSRIEWSTCNPNTDYEFELWNYYVKNVWASTNLISWTTIGSYTWNMTIRLNYWSNWLSANRWYYVKIYDGSNLVSNMIPCYHKQSNVVWMYDTVKWVFRTNQWSWSFTKWPDVN